LTTWFRDYVYIPLGGSRVSKAKVVRNAFVIFLLSGFWHGANWTFIVWGAYHALLFLPLILLGKNRKHTDVVATGRFFPSLKEMGQMLLTFLLAVIGWIVFRANTIGEAWNYLCGLFDKSVFSVPWLDNRHYYLPVVISIALMLVVEWLQRNKEHAFDLSGIKSHVLKFGIYYVMVAALFWFGGHAESFIYFQI
jgi:D-alanyl-lipoteichoic acid acyltransferase DltB (MBOAT superfamily)